MKESRCSSRTGYLIWMGVRIVLTLTVSYSLIATIPTYAGSLRRVATEGPSPREDVSSAQDNTPDQDGATRGVYVEEGGIASGRPAEGGAEAAGPVTLDYHAYVPLVFVPSSGTGEIRAIRVASYGSDTDDCGSSGLPCRTIQHAVNLAESGDAILVAEGTYEYSPTAEVCLSPFGTTAVVCVFNKELTILGGYSAGDWSQANPTANTTIIDGAQSYRGVLVMGTDSVSSALRMEGFTIRNGRARGVPTRSGNDRIFAFGGGMLVERGQATLRNMVFSGNLARGNDTESAYGGSGSGGGLALRNTPSQVVLENITFEENRAEGGRGQERGGLGLGGGLFTYLSTVSGRHIRFEENVAAGGSSTGDGYSDRLHADAQGGAAALQRGSEVVLEDISAVGNVAKGGEAPNGNPGGAFGGAFFTEDAVFKLSGAHVSGNRAEGGSGINDGSTAGAGYARGGGIATTETGFALQYAIVVGNTAKGGDGAVRVGSAAGGGVAAVRAAGDAFTRISNCVIADNLVQIGGGAGERVGGGGGGLWLQGTDAEVIHTSLAQNSLGSTTMQGEAIVLLRYGMPTPTIVDVSFSIISGHSNDFGAAAIHVQPENVVNLDRGLFASNTRDTNVEGVPAAAGTFNGLGSMLNAGAAGFVSPGAPDYDYHILESSPAKDRATGSLTPRDIDQQSRPFGGGSDIGADEYRP